jgi:hypothetical protein
VRPAVVFGGYGVFGSIVARELAVAGLPVVVAGRDGGRAAAAARELGSSCRGVAVDAADGAACRRALAGAGVAVQCAGPFASLGRALLDACLDSGCPYVDIAEDRAHLALVTSLGAAFAARGLAAVTGCSSLPGISGALALVAREGRDAPPAAARVVLFIGNANPKGEAAARAAVAMVGRTITAPQGSLVGFGDPEDVRLPDPFGARPAANASGPEYDLFPPLLGVSSVTVKVAFESALATRAFALAARSGLRPGDRTARLLVRLGRLLPGGTSGGAVVTELAWPDGSRRSAAVVAERAGQRMAALPCALAARALASGVPAKGALTAYELLGARGLLAALAAAGFRLDVA